MLDDLELIKDGLERRPIPIMKAYIGFPEQLLKLPAEIDTLVKIWASMETPSIYEKMEVDELLALYVSFEHVQRDHMDEFSKEEIYKLITCSVDIDNKLVMDLWKDYCRDYRDVEELQFPYSPGPDLYDLESYYKMTGSVFPVFQKSGTACSGRKSGGRAQEHRRRDQPYFKDRMCQLHPKMHNLWKRTFLGLSVFHLRTLL